MVFHKTQAANIILTHPKAHKDKSLTSVVELFQNEGAASEKAIFMFRYLNLTWDGHLQVRLNRLILLEEIALKVAM